MFPFPKIYLTPVLMVFYMYSPYSTTTPWMLPHGKILLPPVLENQFGTESLRTSNDGSNPGWIRWWRIFLKISDSFPKCSPNLGKVVIPWTWRTWTFGLKKLLLPWSQHKKHWLPDINPIWTLQLTVEAKREATTILQVEYLDPQTLLLQILSWT